MDRDGACDWAGMWIAEYRHRVPWYVRPTHLGLRVTWLSVQCCGTSALLTPLPHRQTTVPITSGQHFLPIPSRLFQGVKEIIGPITWTDTNVPQTDCGQA